VKRLRGVYLGRQAYAPLQALQEKLLGLRQTGAIDDTLLLLEHDPVVTLGRGAKAEHVLFTPELLTERGIDVVTSTRGGDVTLHAPGQLVAYPIVDLSPDRRDVRRWVHTLTETMRRVAEECGIAAGRHEEHVGLWADAAAPSRFTSAAEARELVKIGAIGVRISRWVTMHGFALNLAPDLSLYQAIVPCGIREHGVASLASLGGAPLTVRAAATRAHAILCEQWGASLSDLEESSAEALVAAVGAPLERSARSADYTPPSPP
jgi:lipoyl(octanoyl) transferase